MSTILVVDDHEQNRYLLRALLGAGGDEILEAANGAEALELARRTHPDLIISDILMPQMDGFALCRECKRDEHLRDIPLVFYTATYTDPRDRDLAMQLGAARFIVKPVENEEFVAILNEVRQEHAAGQLAALPPPLEEETTFYRLYNDALVRKLEEKMLDLERANRRLVESEERYRRLAENAPDLIYRYELLSQAGITYVSPAAAALTGYTPEEYYANPSLITKIIPTDECSGAQANEQIAGQIAPGQALTQRWLRKDGQVIWVERHEAPVYNEAQELIAVEGIARDITSRVQYERELEAITTVGAALRLALTPADMKPVLLDHLLSILEVEGAALAMFDSSSGELRVELGRGAWAYSGGEIIPPGVGMSARVLATGQPYLTNAAHSEPDLFHPEAFQELSSAAGAPLSAQGQITGLLWVGSARPLSEHDLRLLHAIAEMAANALHRADLHEETIRRVEQLQALQAIDHAITANLDLNLSLGILLEQTLSQLHADAAGLLLYDGHALALDYAAGRGFRGRSYERSHLRLGEGPAGLAAVEQRVVYASDAPSDRFPLLADEGFLAYAEAPLVSKGQIKGVLEVFHRSPFRHGEDWLNFFGALAQQAAIAIDSAQLFDSLQKTNTKLSVAYDATIEGWSRALDLRDKETEGHTLRVADLTLKLARLAGISEEEQVHVRRGVLLHDIGKMGIPDAILLKPGPLNETEWAAMRQHPMHAYEMLAPIAYLRPAIEIPLCHHEKWEGGGYPRGLKGEQIPFAARLFAVVDVWDALTSDRPYRSAWPKEQALAYIREQAGKHFDPRAVELFWQVIAEEAN